MRQLLRFAGVGGAATLLHAVIGGAVAAALPDAPPQTANAAGFLAAVGFGYWGHARLTFRIRGGHATHVPRFLAVAALSLVLSSAITALVCDAGGRPVWQAMAMIVVAVPPLTYLLSRLWAFAPLSRT